MAKTIKIIDLYNLIANKKFDKLPKKVKYRSIVFVLEKRDDFINYKPKEGDWLLNQFLWKLNDEIEILEDEKKEIKPITKKDFETLGYACGEIQKAFTNGWTKSLENKPLKEEKKIPEKLSILTFSDLIDMPKEDLVDAIIKINEILDYLESKEDE